ncbi:hypothetical protein F2P56_019213 [Juglans regia]|uniref:UPF0481 protein At3g47200-like n=2 Tax=Juglans regia TaxID=51240 RepID=A0A2I4EA49_JUGRE|nr:UPF0481 protein At3g47200-like [Juglans regia]XP_018816268.1 UPF0481 protein At3g47200-like [Juglans regia]XP_035548809.1 UPF0481 protein At3g47200-like [Juglans regia]XP_035548810.1 UPF0481 protein At3g47200-like [Juglans regia]XP_035548811.1 UPF0481 protein At3g47200-like [Juglans regia]KAF5463290.1 hypothetical protein F2P56_019213 [Juglans regia]
MEKSRIQQKVATTTSVLTNANQNAEEIHQILDQEAANTLSRGNQHRELVISIKEMVESRLDPLPYHQTIEYCCIYRIPVSLLKLNEEAYTPQVISIGPFHHGTKRLETMEKLKLKYFQRFLQQTDFNVEILVNAIKLHEESVRSCYAETIKFSSDDFVKLILVDGIFIIEFFYGLIWFKGSNSVIRQNNILLNPISWHAITLDLQLLENQLPFFALEILFSLAYASDDEHPSFTSLAIKVFEIEDIRDQEFSGNLGDQQPIRHFVDLTKAFFLPSSRKLLSPNENNDLARSADHLYTVSHLYEAGVKFNVRSCKCLLDLTRHYVDLARAFFHPSSRKLLVTLHESNDLPCADHLYSASQLYEAGVKFKVSSSKCLLDLKFTNGTLEIPSIYLDNETETTYRNILAFEQCHYPHDSHFTDYIVLLSFLINTPKDADLLIRKGIIINWLANSNSVASFINNLGTNIVYYSRKSAYCGLFRDLNAFYRNTKHTWKATLKRDYFGTPWKITSTAAAITFLLLTLVQTICSIIQFVKM